MKKILMRFVPDERDDILVFTFKVLLCSFFGFVAITLYMASVIASNGFSLIVGIALMIWYVWANAKDWNENDH